MRLPPYLICCLLAATSGSAQAGNPARYSDYAQVISSVPVREKNRASATISGTCMTPDPTIQRIQPIASSIAEDVLRQEQHWATRNECRKQLEAQRTAQVSGYWVTYRYAGRNESRFFPNDPGQQIPVRVRLTPLP